MLNIQFIPNFEKTPEEFQKLSKELKNDKKFIFTVLQKNGMILKYVPEKFKYHKDIVLTAVQQNGLSLEFSSEILKKNSNIYKAAIQENHKSFRFLPKELQNDVIISQLSLVNGLILQYASEGLRKHESTCLNALKNNIKAWEYIDDYLKNSTSFVFKSIKVNNLVFKYAPMELKFDTEIIEIALKCKGIILDLSKKDLFFRNSLFFDYSVFKYFDESIKDDKETAFKLCSKKIDSKEFYYNCISEKLQNDQSFILEILKERPEIYKFLPNNLKDDREITLKTFEKVKSFKVKYHLPEKYSKDRNFNLELIEKNPFFLSHSFLNDDKDEMLKFIQKDYKNIMYMSKKLSYNHDFIVKVLEKNGGLLKYFPNEIINNIDMILLALKTDAHIIKYLSYSFIYDKKILKIALRKDGLALEHLTGIKIDKDIIMEAVNQNGLALKFAGECIDDKNIVMKAINQNPLSIEFASDRFKSNGPLFENLIQREPKVIRFLSLNVYKFKKYAVMAIKRNGLVLALLCHYDKDKSFVRKAVEENGMALCYADPYLRGNRDIVIAALKQNGMALEYVLGKLKDNKEIIMIALRRTPASVKYIPEEMLNDRDILACLLIDIRKERLENLNNAFFKFH